MTNQYHCQSYYDDNDQLQNCSCGKCGADQRVDELRTRVIEAVADALLRGLQEKHPIDTVETLGPVANDTASQLVDQMLQAECNRALAAQRQALRDEVMDLLIEIPVTKINPESDEDLTIQMGENAQNRLLYELRTAISTIFEGKENKTV